MRQRGIEYPEKSSPNERKTAIALIGEWGDDAEQCVASYVKTNNEFYSKNKWPLGIALRNASEIWAAWKNSKPSSHTQDDHLAKAAELERRYADMEAETARKNREEDERLAKQGDLL